MIYDLLVNIGNYRGIGRNMDKAIAYLMETDLSALPLGKTEIDGDRVFLNVMEAETHALADDGYEIHREYMDIQIDIEGCEVIGAALDGADLIGDYSPDFQRAAVRGAGHGGGGQGAPAANAGKGCLCVMGPGRFVICMAGEAHAPGGCVEKTEKVKKCVVKVAVDG